MPQRLGRTRVAGRRGDDRAEQRALPGVGERPLDEGGVGPQVVPDRSGAGAGQRLLGHVGEQVGHQRGDRPPPPVHGRLPDLRAAGDLREIEAVKTLFGEHVSGRVQHGGTDTRGTPSGTDGAGFGGHIGLLGTLRIRGCGHPASVTKQQNRLTLTERDIPVSAHVIGLIPSRPTAEFSSWTVCRSVKSV